MLRLILSIPVAFFAVGLCFCTDVLGQGGQSMLFESDEVVRVTLETDFVLLFRNRGDDPEQQPGWLSYLGEDGEEVTQELKVRLRGNFRKNHCDFPPIRLNFAKKASEGTLFEGEDKLKLVTHCKSRNAEYEQYVLLEYLAYRMYNLLTDKSFKVRLVDIRYEDSNGKRKPLSSYGFLIEDVEALALRNEGVYLENAGYPQDKVEENQMLMLSLFQYMIGNTDWSVPVLHNIRLVATSENSKPFVVPYDFDFSGFVNAVYATPDPKLPIQRVRDRLYRGNCNSDEEISTQLAAFHANKDQLYALIERFKPLKRRYRKQTISYLNDFYKTISDNKRIHNAFSFTCR